MEKMNDCSKTSFAFIHEHTVLHSSAHVLTQEANTNAWHEKNPTFGAYFQARIVSFETVWISCSTAGKFIEQMFESLHFGTSDAFCALVGL